MIYQQCAGRFGLHSLPQSEAFYKDCGMTDLGIDNEHEDKLRYNATAKKSLARSKSRRKSG